MDDVYKNIDEHNPNKKLKILIVFDDMAADVLSKRNFSPRLQNYLLEVVK